MDRVWSPTVAVVERANVTRFMRRHSIADVRDLHGRSLDIEWFWDAVVRDLDIEFEVPYRELVDTTRGPAWPRWFVGGALNVATLCVDRWAERTPDADALIWESEDGQRRRLTFVELRSLVDAAARLLRGLGVSAGDTVGIFMPMAPETVAVFHACAKIGAMALPLFSGFGAEAVATRLNDARAKVLVTADGFLRRGRVVRMKETADAAADRAPTVGHVVVWSRLHRADAPWDGNRDVRWEEAIDERPDPFPTPAVDAEHPLLIAYTSGTTGRPKGALLVHGGFLVNVAKDAAYHLDLQREDTLFWVTDMGWIMGPWEVVSAGVVGATLCLYEGAPSEPTPDRLWNLVERYGVTILGVGPSLIRGLATHGAEHVRSHDIGSVRILGATGEPWPLDAYLWLFEEVGRGRCPIINMSGGTEVGALFVAPLPISPLKPCTVGGPALGMDMRILDADGRSVPAGEVGELVCANPWPGMTRGIWKDPERYLASYWSRWEGLWVHGDRASTDRDGFWFLHGRSDDTLNVAGRRLGPAEVEEVLGHHPLVAESAAVGIPHNVQGESIWCVVVTAPGQTPARALGEDLAGLVAERLGKPFRPRRVLFVEDLPRTRSLKIMRRVIRAVITGEDPGDLSSLENPAAVDALRGVLRADGGG
ncbi:MAG: AMP-binding protein [Actinomycetota bacterium]